MDILFGCTSADFTVYNNRVVPGTVLTAWDALTGGTRVTALKDLDGAATNVVTSQADGGARFYRTDSSKAVLWLESGQGPRIAVRPVDITGSPPLLSIGTVDSGAVAASLTGTPEAPVLNLTLPPVAANGVDSAALQDGSVTAPKFAAGAMSAVLLAVARAQPVVSGGDAFDGPDPMWETIFGEPFADAGTPSAGTPAHTFDGGAAA